MATIEADQVVDTRGMLCPMPIVLANKAIKAMEVGRVLKILASDRGALKDFPAWADDTGHELVSSGEGAEGLVFFVRKGADL